MVPLLRFVNPPGALHTGAVVVNWPLLYVALQLALTLQSYKVDDAKPLMIFVVSVTVPAFNQVDELAALYCTL